MIRRTFVGLQRRYSYLNRISDGLLQRRSESFYKMINKYITQRDKILDIGVGSCHITHLLKENGYNVTPLDVQNLSQFKNIAPTIFDGRRIPFSASSFDTCLILAVLHHIDNPEEMIKEAKRVSRKIVIIEDVYENTLEKYKTYFFDSLVNFEFFGHPHTNKKDNEWKSVFRKLGLKLIDSRRDSVWGFKLATYCLETGEM